MKDQKSVNTLVSQFDIAVIGMSCRFPGAENLKMFWNNLVNGVESITRFSDEDLKKAGIPEPLIANPKYVKAAPILKSPGMFDARFFGLTPNEARVMDPQHRILLECANDTLEHAGYDPQRYEGRIGVFTGSAMNTYFMNDFFRSMFIDEYIPTLIANDKDFLSTLISYKLNLRGPSVNIQTACSTSLVAVHLGCQSLINEESDMVLAGAVSVKVPHISGYICDGGGVVSPDAHVRAFDAKANGTVFGSGAGMVLLKRLTDALKDGDTIHAVIKGTAVNNDGSQKAGYTAPSVNSQSEVVIEALSVSDVNPESISYIEAHGSGTPIGDPIEVAALTKAFRNYATRKEFCSIGSVKTNVGHLDVAAGAAGLIKCILALKNKKIPPTINFSNPNPEIDFKNSPFYVNTKLVEWKSNTPLTTGIMSTGMGGTNAFILLEEGPEIEKIPSSSKPKIFILSAKSEKALDDSTNNLVEFLNTQDNVNADDYAYTLQFGRRLFNHRRFFVSKSKNDAIELFNGKKSKQIISGVVQSSSKRPIVFLFPGIGDHYVGMGYDLYKNVKVFKAEVDRCAEILKDFIGADIRDIIYPKDLKKDNLENSKGIDLKKMLSGRVNKSADENTKKLNQTLYAQPALFTIEYAFAKLWMHLGIQPDAIVGHSMGEYVAACLSGVLSLEDALKLIAVRAKLVNTLPQSSMLAVNMAEKDILPLLDSSLSISLINLPDLCVVSGEEEKVKSLEALLKNKNILVRYVQNAHAFHSKMLDPIKDDFQKEISKTKFNTPLIPYTSNLTGNWITEREIHDEKYWSNQSTTTARFSDGLEKAWQIKNAIFLEVGPGNTLSVLAAQHPVSRKSESPITISSLRAEYDNQSDLEFMLTALGKLWLNGVNVNWENLYEDDNKPNRIPLPTYPFQRENYWVDDLYSLKDSISYQQKTPKEKRKKFEDWFYKPIWKKTDLQFENVKLHSDPGKLWMLFMDDAGVGTQIKNWFQELKQDFITIKFGESYLKEDDHSFIINTQSFEDYSRLFGDVHKLKYNTLNIVHLGLVSGPKNFSFDYHDESIQNLGFYSLLFIAQAASKHHLSIPINIGVITDQFHKVLENDLINPKKALIVGPCGVLPKEFAYIQCFNIDIMSRDTENDSIQNLTKNIISEFGVQQQSPFIAYRKEERWIKEYDPIDSSEFQSVSDGKRLRKDGVYLITGGTGGIGLTISKYLAKEYQAKIILTQKSEIPPKSEWNKWLEDNQKNDSLLYNKIQRLIELEELGSEVTVFSADVSDKKAMQKVIDEVIGKYGNINGVIHAAGIVRAGISLAKGRDVVESVLTPKVP